MKRFLPAFATIFLMVVSACAENEPSAIEKINSNVREYLELADSIPIEIAVVDTMYSAELDEMRGQVTKNLNLIDRDLDTLSSLIDVEAYAGLDLEKELDKKLLLNRNALEDSLTTTTIKKLEFQLKQAQLLAKKQVFNQTNRLLNHLNRKQKEGIAGYTVKVDYSMADEEITLELLIDADLIVVD